MHFLGDVLEVYRKLSVLPRVVPTLQALKYFRTVHKSEHGHADAEFHEGIELAELGRHEEAQKVYDRLPERHQGNAQVEYAKARSYAAVGEYEMAAERLRVAIKKDSKTVKRWASEEKAFDAMRDDSKYSKIL